MKLPEPARFKGKLSGSKESTHYIVIEQDVILRVNLALAASV